MTFKHFLSLLEIVLITAIICIVSAFTFYIFRSKNYDKNFQNLKLGSHIQKVKKEWGEPDQNFMLQDTLLVLTYDDGLMIDYVFKFDKQSKKLIEKWSGD